MPSVGNHGGDYGPGSRFRLRSSSYGDKSLARDDGGTSLSLQCANRFAFVAGNDFEVALAPAADAVNLTIQFRVFLFHLLERFH
jgi:hypothetical protein